MRADFSSETMKARKKWLSSFQIKEKNYQQEILYPGKIFFRNEEKNTEKTTVPQTGETDI